jgi:hypothetical protein
VHQLREASDARVAREHARRRHSADVEHSGRERGKKIHKDSVKLADGFKKAFDRPPGGN